MKKLKEVETEKVFLVYQRLKRERRWWLVRSCESESLARELAQKIICRHKDRVTMVSKSVTTVREQELDRYYG